MPTPRTRVYPITCHECRERSVAPAMIARDAEVRYEGVLQTVHVAALPVLRCKRCGDVTEGNDAEAAIHAALRSKLALLQPEEIRAQRRGLGCTQVALAEAIGCAPESLSRWENGMVIQSRATDRSLRAYFAVPAFRRFLEGLRAKDEQGRRASGNAGL